MSNSRLKYTHKLHTRLKPSNFCPIKLKSCKNYLFKKKKKKKSCNDKVRPNLNHSHQKFRMFLTIIELNVNCKALLT